MSFSFDDDIASDRHSEDGDDGGIKQWFKKMFGVGSVFKFTFFMIGFAMTVVFIIVGVITIIFAIIKYFKGDKFDGGGKLPTKSVMVRNKNKLLYY